MRERRVGGERESVVRVGAGALAELGERLGDRPAVVLADERVLALHGGRLPAPLRGAAVALPAGEDAKSLAVLGAALDALASRGLERDGVVVGLGGGAACDLAGLAASLWMRGVEVWQCPTTLLAQVDAAVGGKTAVNLAAGKNLAGTFWPPALVLADTACLATLPDVELRAGLGEALKSAVVGAPEWIDRLADGADAWTARDAARLAELVDACVAVKAAVVEADPREAGPRQALNLGHTFAHAFEREAGYGRVAHGEAVALGLLLAADLARDLDRLEEPELPERLRAAAARLGLPTRSADLEARAGRPLPTDALVAAMRLDKKARGGAPAFVLPRAAGRTEHGVRAPEAAVRRVLDAAR